MPHRERVADQVEVMNPHRKRPTSPGDSARVTFLVEQDEAARPRGVALAGPFLAETRLRHLADQIEEPRRRR